MKIPKVVTVAAVLGVIGAGLFYVMQPPEPADAKEATLYKNPQCDC